jgi:WD40 repeat protein
VLTPLGLHDGGVADFDISLNCAYLVTAGSQDQAIKVWDYSFRGNLVPAFQCFSLNEAHQRVILSNDDQGLVFSMNDHNINTWMFKNSFSDMKLKIQAEEIEKRERTLLQVDTQVPPCPTKHSAPATLEGHSIPSKTLFPGGTHLVGEEQPNSPTTEAMQKLMEDKQTEALKLVAGKAPPKSVRFMAEGTGEEQAGANGRGEAAGKRMGADNETEGMARERGRIAGRAEARQPEGEFSRDCLRVERVHGVQGMWRQSVKWDVQHEFYAVTCSNKVVCNYFDAEESQVVLDNVFMDPMNNVLIGRGAKYLVTTMNSSRNEPTAGFCVYDCSSSTRLHSSRVNSAESIVCADLSAKEDYLLVVYTAFEASYRYIQVWDVLNNKSLVESSLNEEVLEGRWVPFGLAFNEFVLLSAHKLYFWRLNRNNTLQFQCIEVSDLGGKIDKEFSSLAFFQLNDEYKTCVILVGTTNGGMVFVDSRSGVVLGYSNFLINEPISCIDSNVGAVNIFGNSANIYSFFLKAEDTKSLGAFMAAFENNPQIMSLDGKVGAIHFPREKEGLEGLATTNAGTVWFLHWKNRLTLKLRSWHHFGKKMLAFEHNNDRQRCFTSAADFTIKQWSRTRSEEEIDFFVPNRGCLCLASRGDVLFAGFTDGAIR